RGGEEAKARVLAAHAHVERRGKHAGATVGEAVHHPNGGLGAGADLEAAAGANRGALVQLRLGVPAGVPARFGDERRPRGGAAASARDDDAAHLVVGDETRDALLQLHAELIVHRIELVWSIHGENADAV